MALTDLFKKNDNKNVILVVEDSRTQAMQLEFTLEQAGYAVSIARNGKEAVTFLGKQKPALVISDVIMPEMDGYELCLHIKTDEQLKTIPVILMTSLADSNEAVKGLYCGADVLVAKPYHEDFLLTRIRTMLENKKLAETQAAEAEGAAPKGIHISIGGRKHFVTNERLQTIDLLLSSYEIAIQRNEELAKANERIKELEEELGRIKKAL